MDIARLADLGYDWRSAPLHHPGHKFVAATRVGQLVYTSGQISIKPNGEVIAGKVGGDVNSLMAREAAECCAVAAVYAAGAVVVEPEELTGIVDFTMLVNAAPGFTDAPKIANQAGVFFLALFGIEYGWAACTAYCVAALPQNAAVQIKATFLASTSA